MNIIGSSENPMNASGIPNEGAKDTQDAEPPLKKESFRQSPESWQQSVGP